MTSRNPRILNSFIISFISLKGEKDDQQTKTTMVPATLTHLLQLQPIQRRGRGLKISHARQRGRACTQYLEGRFEIVIFSCSFLRSPFKELALQVSESDSCISICLHAHTTKSLSRYVYLLWPFTFIPICTNFIGVFIFHSARSCQLK